MAGRDELRQRASRGDRDAQYALGELLAADDVDEAVRWLTAAAGLDHPLACMKLCALGIELGRDEAEALDWYRRARALGARHRPAALGLRGPDVAPTEQPIGAAEHLAVDEELAAIGDRSAATLVAWRELASEDGSVDDDAVTRAYRWFSVATRQRPGGPPVPPPAPAQRIEDHDTPRRFLRLYEQVLTPPELAAAHRLVEEWFAAGADASGAYQAEVRVAARHRSVIGFLGLAGMVGGGALLWRTSPWFAAVPMVAYMVWMWAVIGAPVSAPLLPRRRDPELARRTPYTGRQIRRFRTLNLRCMAGFAAVTAASWLAAQATHPGWLYFVIVAYASAMSTAFGAAREPLPPPADDERAAG